MLSLAHHDERGDVLFIYIAALCAQKGRRMGTWQGYVTFKTGLLRRKKDDDGIWWMSEESIVLLEVQYGQG